MLLAARRSVLFNHTAAPLHGIKVVFYLQFKSAQRIACLYVHLSQWQRMNRAIPLELKILHASTALATPHF
jgi:hypothetical protein